MRKIKANKSNNVRKVNKANDWEGLNIRFVKSVFDKSRRELKKLTKEELLEEFVQKDYINMYIYLNTKIDLHFGYTQFKNEALKLSKNSIIEYIVRIDDIIEEEDDNDDNDWDNDEEEDDEDENGSKKSDEEIFFSMLKGFFIPKEEIDKIKSKKIKFREFKKLINRYILSMHPDRGASSDVEKKIKNEIILEYNENRNFIMDFAKEYLK
ncbi:hypothetical protein DRP43_04695 [candidate division TA06 bacterium]|uniref:Uncharacterized protein n=1 Tax=candidate division TA06 bacterium TaxID=2250710 RepID=A0A660SGB5_UNCT6|nr:MAG: hypothetical protein DRP43_04695 [candidate division TA06 bacterium]